MTTPLAIRPFNVYRLINPDLLMILLLPIGLLAFSNKWIFSPVGYIDSWLYTGYFRELPQILKAYPNLYHGTRLSWLLPGYVIYHLVPPFIANLVIHLGVFYVATLSLYLIVKILFNRRIALLTTLLMGCYAYFLTSAGWDGVDSGGMAYFLLTMLLLTWAARSGHGYLFLFAAGITCAALVYTNIFWVVLTPVIALYFFFLNLHYHRHPLIRSSVIFGLGIVILTALLGIINAMMNGNFLFFMPSLRASTGLHGLVVSQTIPIIDWIPNASWLAFPLIGVITSILFLLRRRKNGHIARLFPGLYLVAFGIFAANHIIGTFPPLQISSYVSFLSPLLFLAFSAQLSVYLETVERRSWLIILGCAVLFLVGGYVLTPLMTAIFAYWSPLSLIPAFIFGLTGYLILSRSSSSSSEVISKVIFFLLMVSIANLSVYPDNTFSFTSPNTRDGYQAITDSYEAMHQVESLATLFIWYQYNEPLSKYYVSAASLPLIIQANVASRVSDNFPSLTSDRVGFYQPLQPGSKIAIFSIDPDALTKARSTLNQNGLDAQLISVVPIKEGSIQFTITFVELTDIVTPIYSVY